MVRSPVDLAGWLVVLGSAFIGCGSPSHPVGEGIPSDSSSRSPAGALADVSAPRPATPAPGGSDETSDSSVAESPRSSAAPSRPDASQGVGQIAATEPSDGGDEFAATTTDQEPPLPDNSAAPEATAPPTAAPATPATVAAAAAILDLRTFPLPPGVRDNPNVSMAGASFQAAGPVEKVYQFLRDELAKVQWKELEGGYATAQAASGTFAREGFKVSVSVFAASADADGDVRVTLFNHGNVMTDRLPLPPNTTPLYQTPVSSAFLTELSVEDARDAVAQLLQEQGWSPYGTVGDTQNFKQHAVKLLARVTAAPAQGGKTLIDYSSQLMSADIPLPPGSTRAQYSDGPTQLSFDIFESYDGVVDFYRETLAEFGWEPTTERTINIDRKELLIFRNPAKDLMEVELTSVDDVTRVLVRHQTAAEVAEVDRRIEAERIRREELARQPKPKVTLPLPTKARDVESSATRVEFTVDIGEARRAVEALQQHLVDDQWILGTMTLDAMFGTVELSKGSLRVTLTYIESGILRPEITVNVSGGDLELVPAQPREAEPNP